MRSTFKCLAWLLLLSVSPIADAQIQSSLEYDVYFLGGQSNAAGRGDASELPNIDGGIYDGLQTDVQFYWRKTLVTSNGNLTQNQFLPLQPDSGQGLNNPPGSAVEYGPEIAMGRTLADAFPDRNIVIIKYAHGGSNLHTQWAAGGSMYNTFISVVTDSLADITNAGATFNLRGFAWVQGEADAGQTTNSLNYEANLTNLISRVRTDVFGGEQAQIVVSRLSVNQYNNLGNGQLNVRAAQVAVAEADSAVEWLDSDGAEFSTYNINNPIHFDTIGVISMGQAFGEAFVSAESLLGDVNCDQSVDFLDISPFIDLLSSGEFNAKADTNVDGAVDFFDISSFIALLSTGA